MNYRRRSFRTCEFASFNIESQRDSKSTAFSFRATILSTLIPYSRFDRDFKIRFVSSVVRIPGQSGSGTMVILNFGGASVVTGTCLTAGATVGARAAMLVGMTPLLSQFRISYFRLCAIDVTLLGVQSRWLVKRLGPAELGLAQGGLIVFWRYSL
jgi:hypothetical protein